MIVKREEINNFIRFKSLFPNRIKILDDNRFILFPFPCTEDLEEAKIFIPFSPNTPATAAKTLGLFLVLTKNS